MGADMAPRGKAAAQAGLRPPAPRSAAPAFGGGHDADDPSLTENR